MAPIDDEAIANAAQLAQFKQQRATAKGNISRIKNQFEISSSNYNAIDLECRLEIVSSYTKQIMAYQTEIERLDPTDDKRAELEELCIATKSKILTLIGPSRIRDASMVDHTITIPQTNRLPSLKLPKFDGKYTEYKNFIGTFKNLVDDELSLSEIEKFNHLLNCLSGEALLTVKAFQVTEENYSKALKRLEERYDKKCLIYCDSVSQIFDIPKMSKACASDLRKVIDTVSAIYDSLLTIGSDTDFANAMLIHIVLSKVDVGTKIRWNDQLDYSKLPKWSDCVNVMIRRCQSLEINEEKSPKADGTKPKGKPLSNDKKTDTKSSFACTKDTPSVVDTTTSSVECVYCKSSEHSIAKCKQFADIKDAKERFEFVKRNSLCINCLKKGHTVSHCRSSNCRECKRPHHTLLHRSNTSNNSDLSTQSSSSSSNASQAVMHLNSSDEIVLLATALIQVKDKFGTYHVARALLDSGSQINLISDDFVNKLKLKRESTHLNISCVNDVSSSASQKVHATVKSRMNLHQFNTELFVLKSVSSLQPEVDISIQTWGIPGNIVLADPWFYKRQKVDMLFGADIFFELLSIGQIKLDDSMPVIQKTLLGWIVAGKYKPCEARRSCSLVSVEREECLESIDKALRNFWEIEEVVGSKPILSQEHQACENHFSKNLRRLDTGRFKVRLPFKLSPSKLGKSFDIAKRRFLSLERRLAKSPEIREMYNDFMKEYLDLSHMSLVVGKIPEEPNYFIPHQVVLKPQSTSTKLRVVFDASSKSSSGTSLNDALMVGPTIQPELYTTLLKFRCRKFALCADITKMYRQIVVDEKDRNFQLILWRENDSQPIQVYQLNTVTYGTAPAPFLAIRCLTELGDIYKDNFPIGARVVREDFYVDDLVSGADTLKELEQIKKQTDEILTKGGFTLAKWCSNVEISDSSETQKSITLSDNDSAKTLGIAWYPKVDVFKFYLPKEFGMLKPTKRNILSTCARFFDPLGLICPILTKAKIILQELWILKIDWDESIPAQMFTQWQLFLNDLISINEIKIPRYINTSSYSKVQIHGFADASIRAYGCCIFVRSKEDGKPVVRLLTAKSKVAPIKTKSLPRLELCAAHLLAKLWICIEHVMSPYVESIHFWSDSEIVLYWIQSHPSSLNTFVANRIADIQQWASKAIWHHVPTKHNPADLVSRGCNPSTLMKSIWFEGPSFLLLETSMWPASKRPELSQEIKTLEQRKIKYCLKTQPAEPNVILTLIHRSSSSERIIKIVAFIYRFVDRKNRTENLTLTAKELEWSFLKIVEIIQRIEYGHEIRLIAESKVLPANIQKLTPFMHKYSDRHRTFSLLRVGGRLLHAPDNFDVKFPLLLPKGSRFAYLYASHLHRHNLHVGPKILLNLLRQKLWVINAKCVVRSVVRNCVHCFRYKPQLMTQIMGHLPTHRLQDVRPFSICGVDFCGPIYTSYRIRGRPPYKTYIAVFVCFTSKAVHIEPSSDLSTNSFLLVLKRFVSRRGVPDVLHCDNASNFVGANTELKEFHSKFFRKDHVNKINAFAVDQGMQFKFIPPRAPHFGGLWEAAVKSLKGLLYKIVSNAKLTYEELATLLAEIEAILNSRPVSQSADPNDGYALTPQHLLIGTKRTTLVDSELPKDTMCYAKRWQLISNLKAQFWSSFRKEYILQLQAKSKWTTTLRNVKVGDIVLVHDDNLPPQKWLLGRIVTTFTGADGNVRVADVQTHSGTYRRAIHKLALLPNVES